MEKVETNHEFVSRSYVKWTTEKEKCKAILYVIGLEGREIYNTFHFGESEVDKLEVLLKKFEDYCIPKTNVTVIRHRFNNLQKLLWISHRLIHVEGA
jgi:hypothetical protein